jgi:hypothetical protein
MWPPDQTRCISTLKTVAGNMHTRQVKVQEHSPNVWSLHFACKKTEAALPGG